MKKAASVVVLIFSFSSLLPGDATLDRAAQAEKSGDVANARAILAKAAKDTDKLKGG